MEQGLLPLFPLEVVLLPEEPLPLHIFEDRYKQMIGECLAAKVAGSRQQEFGVVLGKDQQILKVGCTARIVNLTRKYEDGRMDILTVGKRRFEIFSTDEERAYLRGEVEFFDDETGADTPNEELAAHAIELFREAVRRLRHSADIPIHLPRPYRYLSFRIAASLPLDLEFKQRLLPMRNEVERLTQLTHVIDGMIEQLDLVEKTRARAGGNGDISPTR
jgi:ATP-dependent Lon protease